MIPSPKHMTNKFSLVVLLYSFLSLCLLVSAEERNCSAQGAPKEWFPPLSDTHGLIDYNTSTPAGWGACSHFSRATCCEKNQTDVVARMQLLMDRAGFSDACRIVTEKALCPLACDPDVGLGIKQPVLCLSTCDEWFDACKNEFFSPIAVGVQRMPLPCSESAVVCSRMGDMYSTGAEMCEAMSVKWSTGDCVTGQVDRARRGKIKPAASTTTSGGRSTNSRMPNMVDMFMRDMRQLQRLIMNAFGSYAKLIDRFLNKYGTYFWLSIPPLVVSITMFLYRRFQKANNNDDDFR